MLSPDATGESLASTELLRLNRWLTPFEDAWQRGEHPAVDAHLPAEQPLRAAVLAEAVLIDLEYRLKQGEPARVEEYTARYPEIGMGRGLLNLITTEYKFRRRREPDLAVQAYLDRFPDHREELSTLLNASDRETPVPRDRPRLPGRSSPPTRLDKYELLGEVGRGAFGAVYRGRDTELGREVAVKIPWPGTLGADGTAERFAREARAAAALRHPGIVALHEARLSGETCYLVSDFVEGQTLAARLKQGRMDFRAAAELLAQVAEAADYAHRQGVVHRDLKPANLLLDAEGRPHILDFGLARQEGLDATLTGTGEMLGTPAYMSPEQARGESHAADARSDVYSLGVILYELLTGELPFRGSSRMVVSQMLDEEPRPPRKLDDTIPRDLETVCLKCLQQEPRRRYPSAGALAEDLRRFLAGEPVRARPVGPWERGWRWVRRHPVAAVLLAGVVLATASALAGLALHNAQIRREQAETDRMRLLWQANFRRARDAVTAVSRVAGDDLSSIPQTEAVRQRLLETAQRFHDQFLSEQGDDPVVRADAARASRELGEIHRLLGEYPKAEAALNRSLELSARLVEAHPQHTDYRKEMSESLHALGELFRDMNRPEEATTAYQRALEAIAEVRRALPKEPDPVNLTAVTLNQLALLMKHTGKPAEAEKLYREALDLQTPLAARYPTNATYLLTLTGTRQNLNLLAEADPQRRAETVAGWREAVRLQKQLLATNPRTPEFRQHLARCCNNLARFLRLTGQHDEAVTIYQEALQVQEELAADFPKVSDYRHDLLTMYANVASALANLQRYRELDELCSRGQQLAHQLLDAFPNSPRVQHTLGMLLHNWAWAAGLRKHYPAARARFEEACARQQAALAREPNNPAYHDQLRRHRAGLAEILLALEDHLGVARWADELASAVPMLLGDLYNAASFFGWCAGLAANDKELPAEERQALRERYAARSVQLLHEAVRLGFTNVKLLRTDYSFVSLKGRPDFEKLLRRLETGKPEADSAKTRPN